MKNEGKYTYDEDYLAIKNWTPDNFGTLYSSDKRYFSAQLRRPGLSIGPGARVLEIGFGGGKFLQYCKTQDWDVTGTELNEALVKIASEKGFNAIAVGCIDNFPENEFDLIVAFDVLEHLSAEQIEQMLRDARRILKVGGSLLARFPNGDSPFGLMNQNADISHLYFLGSGRIRHFAQKVGLSTIYYGGEERVILKKNPISTLKNVFYILLRWVINKIAYIAYDYKFDFASPNAIAVFRKT